MNLAFDLFLLTFNLSQLHNREKIIQLFIEGLQEIFKPSVFEFSDNPAENMYESFEMKSRQSHYGYINFKRNPLFKEEHHVLICNAIQMVAVIIDNLDFSAKLEAEKNMLQEFTDLKLNELKKTVKDLEDTRSASINLIEDLTSEIEKRKIAEKLISENEKKLRLLYTNMTQGVFYQLYDGTLVDINPAGLEMFGITPDQFMGRTSFHPEWKVVDENYKLLAPEEHPSMQALHSGKDFLCTVGVFNPLTKSYKWLIISAKPQFTEGDSIPYSVFVTMHDITDRKLNEEKLRLLSSRNEAILGSVLNIIMEVDKNKVYIWSNSSGFEFFGDDVLGKEASYYFEGEQETYNAVKPVFNGSQDRVYVESWQRRKDGEKRLLAWWCKVLKDEKENVTGIISSAADITENKKNEYALKESEQKFRKLFEHSPVGKSMTGVDGSLHVNESFCRIIGYSEDELKNKIWKDISHPDDIEVTDKIVKSLITGESESARFEKRYLHKNGSIIYTEVSTYLQRDNNGNPEYFITTINDISDRKQAESKLIASEERYSLVISASEQGIWDWNVETNEVFFSEQWKKQIGYEDHEIENNFSSWIEQLHPDDKESCQLAVQSYLNNPIGHFFLEFRFRHKDGSYRWIHNKSASVKSEDGRVLRMFGTHTDITERKKAEAEIKKLNDELEQRVIERTAQLNAANKELEAFSYSVSHDLRAPLRAIHSFTSILKEDYKDTLDDEGKRIFGIIENSSVHMGQLIDDLLSFSRIGRTEIKYSKIDMVRLAGTVYNELLSTEEQKRIDFKLGKLPVAYGDFATVKQVIVNLISNSIKYSSVKESPMIEVGCEKNNNTTVYFVKDNGVGFDMQYVHKLFGVFQRLHSNKEFEGNGVGLAIVQRIIHRHGGKVWAEAEVGKGATFYFTLPVQLNDNRMTHEVQMTKK